MNGYQIVSEAVKPNYEIVPLSRWTEWDFKGFDYKWSEKWRKGTKMIMVVIEN